MIKLTKKQIEERDRIQAELTIREAAFESAREALNEMIVKANEWAEEVATEIDDYMSQRTDKWLDGERGQAYDEWKTAYQNFSLDEIDEPELPGEEAFTDLEEEPNL